jgi:hypothetical protein
MASLATIVRGFVGTREEIDLMNVAVRPRTESFRLRPLANEDVYFFVKRIDNAAVVRAADPAARRASFRAVATGFAVAMFVIAGLFPAAYNTMEGYHIQSLRQEQAKLKQDRAALNYAEAKLLSPQNMNKMAATLKMVDPAPQQVQFLEGTAKREAQNRMPLGIEEAIQ